MEKWNNVELNDLSKKSYTLNHAYDGIPKTTKNNNIDANNTNGSENGSDAPPVNANESAVLKPGSDIKPKVDVSIVEGLVRRLYGITTSEIKEIISYDDRNYYIQEDRNIKNPLIISHWPHGYVLKVLNALDSKKTDFVDAQNQLMIYLSKHDVECPKPVSNVNGKYFSMEHINGSDHIVRLLEFLPGKMFHQVEITNYLLFQSGEYIAKIDRALKNFSHDAYETHKTVWMLQSIPQLREFLYALQDHSRKAMVEEIIESFEREVLTKLDTFEKQIIHGDFNEQNIVVNQLPGQSDYKITGIIDFGDTNKSPLIFEVGIAMTYMMLQAKTLESGGIFLAGYTSIRPLSTEEKSYLKYCVAARLAQSLVMGAYTHTLDPTNEYVLVTQEEGWKLIEALWRNNLDNIDEMWQVTGDKYLIQSFK
ncbi:hydroxylysine kinase [Teleopsis dalmanni]|uniref:hydroxylysine kinase n=1 Tax=Teleopsis dalmanni TaxID=139649 RepID=UPI0018CC898A|nr:hydroxylysine kinase [Teleopsis dalmanni]XP_037960290.1 hydroxylysine kinase [Teleopsis dalmanni]